MNYSNALRDRDVVVAFVNFIIITNSLSFASVAEHDNSNSCSLIRFAAASKSAKSVVTFSD